MRLIDADKLHPDCLTKDGTLAISQSQIANAPTIQQVVVFTESTDEKAISELKTELKNVIEVGSHDGEWILHKDRL